MTLLLYILIFVLNRERGGLLLVTPVTHRRRGCRPRDDAMVSGHTTTTSANLNVGQKMESEAFHPPTEVVPLVQAKLWTSPLHVPVEALVLLE